MSKRTIQDYLSQLDNLGFQDPKSGINVERGDLQYWQALANEALEREKALQRELCKMEAMDEIRRGNGITPRDIEHQRGWHGLFEDEECK